MRWVSDLNPGIKALPARPFKILLWPEDDLVDASGDLELGCLSCPLAVTWREERHAATISVGSADSGRVNCRPRERE